MYELLVHSVFYLNILVVTGAGSYAIYSSISRCIQRQIDAVRSAYDHIDDRLYDIQGQLCQLNGELHQINSNLHKIDQTGQDLSQVGKNGLQYVKNYHAFQAMLPLIPDIVKGVSTISSNLGNLISQTLAYVLPGPINKVLPHIILGQGGMGQMDQDLDELVKSLRHASKTQPEKTCRRQKTPCPYSEEPIVPEGAPCPRACEPTILRPDGELQSEIHQTTNETVSEPKNLSENRSTDTGVPHEIDLMNVLDQTMKNLGFTMPQTQLGAIQTALGHANELLSQLEELSKTPDRPKSIPITVNRDEDHAKLD